MLNDDEINAIIKLVSDNYEEDDTNWRFLIQMEYFRLLDLYTDDGIHTNTHTRDNKIIVKHMVNILHLIINRAISIDKVSSFRVAMSKCDGNRDHVDSRHFISKVLGDFNYTDPYTLTDDFINASVHLGISIKKLFLLHKEEYKNK